MSICIGNILAAGTAVGIYKNLPSSSSISKIFSVCGWPVCAYYPADSTMRPTNFYMAACNSLLTWLNGLNATGNEEIVTAKHGVGLSVEGGVHELLRAEVMHEIVEECINSWWNSH